MPQKRIDQNLDFSHLRDRPPIGERLFTSSIVEEVLEKTTEKIADDELKRMFIQCYPNALDTAVYFSDSDDTANFDTFIITGDIPAMWLRDSTNQMWQYLPLTKDDEEMRKLFIGLLNRHAQSILADSYANAFEKSGEVWERKYELDSLGSFFRLSSGYYSFTQDLTPFDARWGRAVAKALGVILIEQNTLEKENIDLLYNFKTKSGHLHPAVRLHGYGYPGKKCGLSRCVFRPSDDECVYPYHIPANALIVTSLRQLLPILEQRGEFELKKLAQSLVSQIEEGIKRWGIVNHPEFGPVYAYEVDGFGSTCIMDDPNLPSLLSLPYLGYCAVSDPVYQNTRKLVLSHWNSFFAHGKVACGITSAHVGVCDRFWPLATITQALTTQDRSEIDSCLTILKNTHAGTYFIHESIHVDDPHHFTRHWFIWANSLFSELVLTLV